MGVKNKRKSSEVDDNASNTPAVSSSKKPKQEERKPDVAVIIPPKEKKSKKKKSKGRKSIDTSVVEEKDVEMPVAEAEPALPPTKIRKPRTKKVEGEEKKKDSAVAGGEVSKVKKKKKKSKKSNEEIKPRDVENLKAKGVEYLKQWKNDRSVWKFQKLRQIWLIDNMLDATQLTDGLFSVFLEYVAGAKGKLVDNIVAKANSVIKAIEESKKPDLEDVKYKRSRMIIQSLGEGAE